MGVIAAFRSLNAEQKGIIKNKVVDVTRPVDDVIALLRPIATCDKLAGKGGKFGCFGALCLLGLVITMILGGSLPGLIRIALILLFVVASAGLLTMWKWTRGIDVNDGLRQFAL